MHHLARSSSRKRADYRPKCGCSTRPEHLARLLKACEGRDFTSRRDTAIILLLVDTGMRRAECVGMTVDDVDLDQRIVWVLGEGRRPRALPIGRKTAQALDRYLRVREGHRLAHLPQLWVGRNGRMTPSGIYHVVHHRARVAGLPECTRISSGTPLLPPGWLRAGMRMS